MRSKGSNSGFVQVREGILRMTHRKSWMCTLLATHPEHGVLTFTVLDTCRSVLLREVSMTSDEVLFRFNEVCNDLYIISSSSVNLLSTEIDGEETVCNIFQWRICGQRLAHSLLSSFSFRCTQLDRKGAWWESCPSFSGYGICAFLELCCY